jgi:hypothetical protein
MAESGRLTRLVTEGLVIVGSILLAFWIDAWWDSRQLRVAELAALESVRIEAEQNRVALDDALATNQNRLARLDYFIRATPAELRGISNDSVAPLVDAFANALTYDPDVSATGLFLNGGAPVTERGREVREAAARWTRQLEDAEEERASLWSIGDELGTTLSDLALEAAPEGVGYLSHMLSRLGSEAIVELRSDPRFVSAALRKANYQINYLLELEHASERLDTLRATFH